MANKRIPDWLAVFVGGVAGTAARAGLDEAAKAPPVRGLFLSWSTLTVNLLAAWVAGRLARGDGDAASLKTLKLLIGTGFAGAFTTYGTYIVASAGYVSRNGIAEAVAQSLGLLALGAACAWAGVRVGAWVCPPVGGVPGGEES